MDPKTTELDEQIIQDLDFLLSLDVLQEAEELELDMQDSEIEEEM